MGGVLTIIQTLVYDAMSTWSELFETHACKHENCECACYSDEQRFVEWREKAHLASYAEDVIGADVIGKAILCNVCEHDRGEHGTLQKRLLRADMMPNGGLVYMAMQRNEQTKRRNARCQVLNKASTSSSSASSSLLLSGVEDGGSSGATCMKRQVVVTDEGEGEDEDEDEDEGKSKSKSKSKGKEGRRIVRNGDRIRIKYQVLKDGGGSGASGIMSGKADTPITKTTTVTVGGRDVIEGLDRGLVGAVHGVRRRIAVAGDMAYGGEDGDMLFSVEVMDFMM